MSHKMFLKLIVGKKLIIQYYLQAFKTFSFLVCISFQKLTLTSLLFNNPNKFVLIFSFRAHLWECDTCSQLPGQEVVGPQAFIWRKNKEEKNELPPASYEIHTIYTV